MFIDHYSEEIARRLPFEIATSVAYANHRRSRFSDEHHSEYEVQGMIVDLLLARVPHHSLVDENRMALASGSLGACIPDILVTRPGGLPWAFVELKTLLVDDQLSEAQISRDLAKLCAYKEAFPEAAALFVLVGSRAKLFNPQRATSWCGLKIHFRDDVFGGDDPIPQAINDDYVALPSGSHNKGDDKVVCYIWEIVKATPRGRRLGLRYTFTASMAGV